LARRLLERAVGGERHPEGYDASGMFIYSLPTFVPAPSSTIVRSAAIPRGGY
jgi:hypothetical protein